MLTDTPQTSRQTHARNFALRGTAWSLGLFSLVRLSWLETHAVVPFTQLQARLAQSGFGRPALPVDVTLACSGADALALCLGAILAYPASWPMRLGGATGAGAVILTMNIVRIGTLGRAIGSSWFEPLHVYVWPALLVFAIAGYAFSWMRFADSGGKGVGCLFPGTLSKKAPDPFSARLTRRFVFLTVVFLVVFTAASPFYLENTHVLAVASLIASAAAVTLSHLGIHASAAANVLWTARGGFLVTQECISTPLIPVYLAAVFTYSSTWRSHTLGLVATVPLFVGLAIARLLVVALPAVLVGSPLVLIHAFYQLLLAAVVVVVAAVWRHGSTPTAWRRALFGGVLGAVLVYALSIPSTRVLASVFAASAPLDDPQGAIALLPSFQVGLYVALCVAAFVAPAWRSFATGLAVLGFSQITIFAALQFVARHSGLTPHVRDVRAWTLAAPLLLIVAMVRYDRPRG